MGKMGVIFFLSSLLLMAVTIRAQYVRDTDNKRVTNGGHYFIIDKVAAEEWGEIIKASHAPKTSGQTCPRVGVVPYEENNSYYKTPVNISLNRGNPPTYIYEVADISIKYDIDWWPCRDDYSPVWTINDHETPGSDISFGGSPNSPSTTFRILGESGGGYKFAHLNTITKKLDVVGVHNDPDLGYKRLILTSYERPFIFVLQNAETTFKSSSMLSMVP